MTQHTLPDPPGVPEHWPDAWTVDPRWFEDDAFWEAVRPALFAAGRWDEAEVEAVQVAAMLGVTPPDRILDVACGPGRHLLPLAEFGYRVTGLDRTAAYLDEAQTKAHARGLHIQTVLGDVRSFGSESPQTQVPPVASGEDGLFERGFEGLFEGLFEGAIWLDSSIGYSPLVSDDLEVLRSVRRLLRPGARLMVETLGLELTLGDELPEPIEEEVEALLVDGRPWVLQRRISAGGWMEARWGPVNGRPLHYRHRLFRSPDLLALLQEAGFSKTLSHGGLDGSPYSPEASTLIVLAER